jgi:crotonobetainyl-CoA:carnitine CoA-transferase CaiB-like acyl-CoA transferase
MGQYSSQMSLVVSNSMHQETTPGALSGIRVIDLTRVFAGPFTSQILGDLGADVIKVERLKQGDESRDYGVDEGESKPGAPFLAHNRNKKSIAINIKTEQGKEVLKKLVEKSDVLIHNFRPGVMERLGLGYDLLSAINPGLIYGSISGFGPIGSMSKRAANDLSIQSFSGLLSITGHPGGPPTRNPSSVADLTAGMYLTVGILAGLVSRSVTGKGQEIATSMLGGQLNYLNHFLTDFWMSGRVPEKWGTANRLGLPNEAFPTKDGWVCITSANDDMWKRCAIGLGIGKAADDPKFNVLKARYANRKELVELVASATSRLTTEECLLAMEEAKVPCVPVNTIPEIANHAILEETGATVEMAVEGGRSARLVQTPLWLSATPVSARLAPPKLGEHTDEILKEHGFSDDEIRDLRGHEVIG